MNLIPMNVRRSALLFVGILVGSALAGCSADATEPTEPTEEKVASTSQAVQKGGGGSGSSCIDQYQSCYIDCGVSYPVDDHWRAGCERNCDTLYRICGTRIGGGGGGIIMH